VNNGNGTVTYTSAAGFTGVDSFKYTVADNLGAVSNIATVTVTVSGSVSPIAVNDTATTSVATSVVIGVLANDTVGGTPTLTIVTPPANGTAAVNANGSVTFTPAAGFAGTVSFTYKVTNAAGTSNTATVTVTVTETVTTTRQQFTANGATWRIDGSTNARVAGETVTIYVGNAINPAKVVGTVTVANNGSFTLQQQNSPVTPDATGNISIGTSAGGVRLAIPLTLR